MESQSHDHERGIGTPTAPCKHCIEPFCLADLTAHEAACDHNPVLQRENAVRGALATTSDEDLNRACNLLTAVTASDLYQSLVQSEGTSEAAPIPNSLIQPFLNQLVTGGRSNTAWGENGKRS